VLCSLTLELSRAARGVGLNELLAPIGNHTEFANESVKLAKDCYQLLNGTEVGARIGGIRCGQTSRDCCSVTQDCKCAPLGPISERHSKICLNRTAALDYEIE
jgi:hypothetical protein